MHNKKNKKIMIKMNDMTNDKTNSKINRKINMTNKRNEKKPILFFP
jgi:hypothetical protein